jgi:sarcosine oxidase subunit gamma
MADLTALRRSPLAHLGDRMAAASDPAAVRLSETAYTGMVSLRVDPTSPAATRVEAVLGCALPAVAGSTTGNGGRQVLWLGPDEWLVVTDIDPGALTDQLSASIGEEYGLALDVSANRTILELEGPKSRAVLEKGCPLDVHSRRFSTGSAASTTLARVPVILWQTGESSYRLLPRSSFAEYVARWVLDAMAEYTDR